MANPKIIALLCAGSNLGGSGGGHSRAVLTRQELAGLLAGCSDTAMDFALAKWALDEAAERLLIAKCRVYAAHLAQEEGWPVVKGRPTIANLAAVAVFESIRPAIHLACGGTGRVGGHFVYQGDQLVREPVRVCKTCGGTGRKKFGVRDIAEACGLDHVTYWRQWRNRYAALCAWMGDWDSEVRARLGQADIIAASGLQ
ncbi:hypothetical protein [Methylomonas koyamae]|uniref:hypothetical protein n=1 Tax=Methylomonas koyamae TaxID=702114 RepID=UPI00112C3682|nr:hypothetical protein [Methylomonas koyamae]TPQ24924.1 hypothetical protein C2U68_17250 [Methylomonas koyamae]